MKTALSLLILFLLFSAFATSVNNHSNSLNDKVKFVEVDHGVYVANIVETTGKGSSISGLSLKKQTDTIPCTQGTYFGTNFRIDMDRNKDIQVSFNWKFPAKMNKPSPKSDEAETGGITTIGSNKEACLMYGLDKEYELLPGPWVFTLSYKGKLLYTRTFILVK